MKKPKTAPSRSIHGSPGTVSRPGTAPSRSIHGSPGTVSHPGTEPSRSIFTGRSALVTGATGMVGSWLVKELLAQQARVVALIRDQDPQSELFRSGDVQRVWVVSGDLEDPRSVERAVNEHECEFVFHLGAQALVGVAHRSPWPTLESNVRGTYNVLEACRVHQDLVKSLVIASSDKAYGEQAKLPYTEHTPLEGRHPYEVSKTCADLIAQAYHRTYGLPLAIARCGNIFGGGDLNWSRIVPGTIRSLLRGERPVIRSDGRFKRDYFYVKDAVQAYLLLAGKTSDPRVRGNAFNFGPGKPLTVLQIVDTLRSIMGTAPSRSIHGSPGTVSRPATELLKPRILDQAVGEIRDQYLSAAKARSILGWRSRYALNDALAETIDWYRRFLA